MYFKLRNYYMGGKYPTTLKNFSSLQNKFVISHEIHSLEEPLETKYIMHLYKSLSRYLIQIQQQIKQIPKSI